MLDIFDATTGAFHIRRLTEAVNKVPHTPQQCTSLGLFEDRQVDSDLIAIEEKDGVIEILPETTRQGVSQQITDEKATLRPFRIPAFKQSRTLNADEVFRVREFGSEDRMRTIEAKRDEELARMRRNHDVTKEWRFIGALRGQILDSDGTTVKLNLFTEFGVSQETEVDFDLPTAGSGAIMEACSGIVRKIRTNLGAAPATGVHAFCSPEFWDALVKNAEVRDSYLRWRDGEFLRTGQVFGSFSWGGIDWEEYRGSVGATQFIPADKAIFFPKGVPGLYLQHWAPAPWIETVGTRGMPIYAKAAIDPKFQAYIEIETQSHGLPVVTRPKVLMLGKKA